MRWPGPARSEPELIIDFATLTGAARVALGPDLPALFANDDELAERLLDLRHASMADPVWRMPLWDGYDEMLKSDLADLSNAADSPLAGAVTAALFLRRFVPDGTPWAHLDTFAWRPAAKPGRPKGGDALGLQGGLRAASTAAIREAESRRIRPRFSRHFRPIHCNNSPSARLTPALRDDEEISEPMGDASLTRAGCAR